MQNLAFSSLRQETCLFHSFLWKYVDKCQVYKYLSSEPGTWGNFHCAIIIVLTRTGILMKTDCVQKNRKYLLFMCHLVVRLTSTLCYLNSKSPSLAMANSCFKLMFLPLCICLYFSFLVLVWEAHWRHGNCGDGPNLM